LIVAYPKRGLGWAGIGRVVVVVVVAAVVVGDSDDWYSE
jgi:hypothetical protein